MSPRMQQQDQMLHDQERAPFVGKKAEIDLMLKQLQRLSDDHFGYSPDEITWSDAGTLEHYAELLERITDSAFKEGEHVD